MSKPRSNWQDVHGIILLNKPKGITSNKALQKVRHILNAKKAGHTGSLDPMATGLLPCCFGDATKVAGLMLNADKIYLAECQIGSQTDTGDSTGVVVKTSDKIHLSNEEIKQATEQLTGSIDQVPPMYSALHHKGKRLYDFARAGIEVERESRPVKIHYFKTLGVKINDGLQTIQFEIKVSKGTYIRTLLEDFAISCGTSAHMTSLHRTELGILSQPMISIDQLKEAKNPHELMSAMDIALEEYNKVRLEDKHIKTLIHGLQFQADLSEGIYRVYNQQDEFLGLAESQKDGKIKVKNLFLKSYQGI